MKAQDKALTKYIASLNLPNTITGNAMKELLTEAFEAGYEAAESDMGDYGMREFDRGYTEGRSDGIEYERCHHN